MEESEIEPRAKGGSMPALMRGPGASPSARNRVRKGVRGALCTLEGKPPLFASFGHGGGKKDSEWDTPSISDFVPKDHPTHVASF